MDVGPTDRPAERRRRRICIRKAPRRRSRSMGVGGGHRDANPLPFTQPQLFCTNPSPEPAPFRYSAHSTRSANQRGWIQNNHNEYNQAIGTVSIKIPARDGQLRLSLATGGP